jgi:phosphatidylglycerophosphatase A
MSGDRSDADRRRPEGDASAPSAREVLRSPVHLLAFGGGAGLAPVAPGTFGTLVGIPLWWLLAPFGPVVYGAAMLLLFGAGCWICGASARRLGMHDYGGIVFDEVVGYLVSAAPLLAAVPSPGGVWAGLAAAFLLFRLFDVWKPWPVRALDRRVHGGFGIMLDDAVAALFAAALLALALRGWGVPR